MTWLLIIAITVTSYLSVALVTCEISWARSVLSGSASSKNEIRALHLVWIGSVLLLFPPFLVSNSTSLSILVDVVFIPRALGLLSLVIAGRKIARSKRCHGAAAALCFLGIPGIAILAFLPPRKESPSPAIRTLTIYSKYPTGGPTPRSKLVPIRSAFSGCAGFLLEAALLLFTIATIAIAVWSLYGWPFIGSESIEMSPVVPALMQLFAASIPWMAHMLGDWDSEVRATTVGITDTSEAGPEGDPGAKNASWNAGIVTPEALATIDKNRGFESLIRALTEALDSSNAKAAAKFDEGLWNLATGKRRSQLPLTELQDSLGTVAYLLQNAGAFDRAIRWYEKLCHAYAYSKNDHSTQAAARAYAKYSECQFAVGQNVGGMVWGTRARCYLDDFDSELSRKIDGVSEKYAPKPATYEERIAVIAGSVLYGGMAYGAVVSFGALGIPVVLLSTYKILALVGKLRQD